MLTSSNGSIFRVTDHLCGPRWIPRTQRSVTRSFEVFFDLRSNKRSGKHWWGWWFETPSCPLWRHGNVDMPEAVKIGSVLAQWIPILPVNFEILWVRQLLVNVVLFAIKGLKIFEMTAKLKNKLFAGHINTVLNFWNCWLYWHWGCHTIAPMEVNGHKWYGQMDLMNS